MNSITRRWSALRLAAAAAVGVAAFASSAQPQWAPTPATVGVVDPAAPGPAVGASELRDRDGVVFRRYGRWGYRFQPLLSFAALNNDVSERKAAAAVRLATALVARGVRRGDALYWEYDFPYHGPAPWRSGFVQAVAAQALARTGVLVGDTALVRAGAASFRGLRELLMPLGGGEWVREYEHTHEAILNAQLQSFISLASYAKIVNTAPARRVVAELEVATRRLLPRFELGCWSRYELGGGPADLHYHAYHVELLRRLTVTRLDSIWSNTYLRWSRCAHMSPYAHPLP